MSEQENPISGEYGKRRNYVGRFNMKQDDHWGKVYKIIRESFKKRKLPYWAAENECNLHGNGWKHSGGGLTWVAAG